MFVDLTKISSCVRFMKHPKQNLFNFHQVSAGAQIAILFYYETSRDLPAQDHCTWYRTNVGKAICWTIDMTCQFRFSLLLFVVACSVHQTSPPPAYCTLCTVWCLAYESIQQSFCIFVLDILKRWLQMKRTLYNLRVCWWS